MTEPLDKPQPGAIYRRTVEIRAEDIDSEARTVKIAFSSETPVRRFFGLEILSHDRQHVNMERMHNGAAVLRNHDENRHVGVVERARIDAGDKMGRAEVKLSRNPAGMELLNDLQDGIVRHVSVGYEVRHATMVENGEDGPVYLIDEWTPLEASFVAVPADHSVGVGRSSGQARPPTQREKHMSKTEQTDGPSETTERRAQPLQPITQADLDAAVKAANERSLAEFVERQAQRDKEVAEILALGRKHHKGELAEKAVAEQKSLADFRGILLEALPAGTELEKPHSALDLSETERQQFSISRAILARLDNDWSGAEFERECSDEIAKRIGKRAQGFYLPYDIMTRGIDRHLAERAPSMLAGRGGPLDMAVFRAVLDTVTAGGASELVGTDHLGSSFIDVLRNRIMLLRMGARSLTGLRGNVNIPKQTASTTAGWRAQGAAAGEGSFQSGQVQLSPKSVGAWQEYTRELLAQSDPSVDGLISVDLAAGVALAIDAAGINGSGTGNEPRGILNTSGIGSGDSGATGGPITWQNVVKLETDVATANADINALGYLTNAQVRGSAKTTLKASGVAGYIWGEASAQTSAGMGEMNGYAAGVSQQVPSNLEKSTSGQILSALIFGNFDDLIMAEWGMMDLIVNPYAKDKEGVIRTTVQHMADIAVRRAQSFAALQDLNTG